MGKTTRPPAYARPCRRGLHVIPAEVMGCRPCNAATKEARDAEYKRTRREAVKLPYKPPPRVARTDGRVPSYFKRGFAPAVVLDGAACSPATADLFDPADASGRLTAAERDRIAQAKAICSRCPVLDACRADAIEQKRVGVWGGVYLSASTYVKSRKNNAA